MSGPVEILQSHARVENPAVLRVQKRDVDHQDYKHPDALVGKRVKSAGYRSAQLSDVSRLLKGNWLLYDEALERVVLAYLRIPEDISPALPFLHRVRFDVGARWDGTPSRARVVGYTERNPVRQRDFCRMAALATDDPEAHAAILHYAALATPHYASLNPEMYAAHLAMSERVLDEYRIEGSPFTSGILNKDNVLPFHYDAGNFREVWSLMLGWKRDIGPDDAGNAGELVIPEYDLALEIADNTLTAFDGQMALHGVTPFKKTSRYAYRYTLVAYSKVKMWACLSLDEEIARAKKQRTAKEEKRWREFPTGRARTAESPAPSTMKDSGTVLAEK